VKAIVLVVALQGLCQFLTQLYVGVGGAGQELYTKSYLCAMTTNNSAGE